MPMCSRRRLAPAHLPGGELRVRLRVPERGRARACMRVAVSERVTPTRTDLRGRGLSGPRPLGGSLRLLLGLSGPGTEWGEVGQRASRGHLTPSVSVPRPL